MSTNEMGRGWIRPASEDEVFVELLNQNHCMLISYCLTLNAKAPLDHGHVKQALTHLYRQVPTLRLYLQQRDGGPLWWCEMQTENIDFQVLEDSDVQSEHIKMYRHQYNSSCGPLWRARLLPAPNQVPCPMEEIGQDFPHQYYIIFGFHHGITDGTSNVKILGQFIHLLNSVINGDAIDDKTQFGHHDDGNQTLKQREKKLKELSENPEYYGNKIKEFESFKKTPFIVRSYSPEEGVTPCTLVTTYDLDKDSTKRFITKCKAEGVSVNSGFCAMINAAIVEMAKEKGIEEDIYNISMMNTVNMRRYWTGDTSRALGFHVGYLMQKALTPKNVTQDLWSHARSIHKELHANLQSSQIFEDSVIIMGDFQQPEGENPFENIPAPWVEYATANVGNLDQNIPGEMPHVQITHIMRTTCNHKLGNTMDHMMHTFRGRFLYELDYASNLVSTKTAKYFVNKIFDILKKNI